MKSLFKFFSFWTSLSVKYDSIKKDENRKQKSVYFGVHAIISALILAALFTLCVWGIFVCVKSATADSLNFILMWVLAGILIILAVGILPIWLGGSLMRIIYQLRLNRKPIGWVALAVYILSIVVSAVVLIILL